MTSSGQTESPSSVSRRRVLKKEPRVLPELFRGSNVPLDQEEAFFLPLPQVSSLFTATISAAQEANPRGIFRASTRVPFDRRAIGVGRIGRVAPALSCRLHMAFLGKLEPGMLDS